MGLRSTVWNIGIYAEPADFALDRPLGKPVRLFLSRKPRFSRAHIHTQADPFLYAATGELYLFFEVQRAGQVGRIEAYRTSDLKSFEHLGIVLQEPHHLSYPFVFGHEGEHYLLPETRSVGEVSLYRFANFPFNPRKVRVLLRGAYVDSSLVHHDGRWFLFTSSARGMEIFHSDDILRGKMLPHAANPISTDPRYLRNGGAPIRIGDSLFRPAQDCADEYGRNLHIFRIVRLTDSVYEERLVAANYLSNSDGWNSVGGHHLSIAAYNGRTVVAADGKQYDYFLNKVPGLFFRLTGATH